MNIRSLIFPLFKFTKRVACRFSHRYAAIGCLLHFRDTALPISCYDLCLITSINENDRKHLLKRCCQMMKQKSVYVEAFLSCLSPLVAFSICKAKREPGLALQLLLDGTTIEGLVLEDDVRNAIYFATAIVCGLPAIYQHLLDAQVLPRYPHGASYPGIVLHLFLALAFIRLGIKQTLQRSPEVVGTAIFYTIVTSLRVGFIRIRNERSSSLAQYILESSVTLALSQMKRWKGVVSFAERVVGLCNGATQQDEDIDFGCISAMKPPRDAAIGGNEKHACSIFYTLDSNHYSSPWTITVESTTFIAAPQEMPPTPDPTPPPTPTPTPSPA
ncbi:hypothetical protein GQ44DRAFT_763792 [Phaeosphaeriaceae sp. PMI808]|nr:hypothetical protein GQ44DRAFT_763792 [Phaeosphaeriaceae sp. PMI808]